MRLLALALLVAAPAFAQPTADAACSYADCAIRVEPRFFFGPEIVRGAPGQEVSLGRVGYLTDGLEDAVSASPLALEHAGSARRARFGSLVSIAAGIGLSAYSLSRAYDGDFPAQFDVLYFGGLGLIAVGTVFEIKSQREQSRAVWEYNRAVAEQ